MRQGPIPRARDMLSVMMRTRTHSRSLLMERASGVLVMWQSPGLDPKQPRTKVEEEEEVMVVVEEEEEREETVVQDGLKGSGLR